MPPMQETWVESLVPIAALTQPWLTWALGKVSQHSILVSVLSDHQIITMHIQ